MRPSERDPSPIRTAIASEPTDAELVERAIEGDRWAVEALYRRHVRDLLALAIRLLGDQSEAEDIVQEAFVRVLGGLDDLADPAAFRGWLRSIAVRLAHRRFRRWKMLKRLGFVRTPSAAPLSSMFPTTMSPERMTELRRIERRLEGLPVAARTAWILRFVEGYSLREAADACNCSLATIKRRIAKAQRQIQIDTGATEP